MTLCLVAGGESQPGWAFSSLGVLTRVAADDRLLSPGGVESCTGIGIRLVIA